jgi:hypothetical protein
MTPERLAVEKWLAQWGIHKDGEILGLLDSIEAAARVAAPSDGTVDRASLVTFVLRPGFADGRPSGPRTERGHALASSLRRRLPDVDIDYDEWVREIEVDAVTLALGPTRVAAPSDGLADALPSEYVTGQPEGWTADPGDGLRTVGDLSAQVSAILFGAVDDETFERVMGVIRRTEAFVDLDLYRALQPSWHAALMTYDPPDPIPAGGWSRLMPHTDEAIRIFTALRAALAATEQPETDE